MVHIRTPMLSLLVLLAVGLLATHASAARRPLSRRRCCTTYGSQIPFNAIKGYSVQTDRENCSINAIIFHTKKGMESCADPSEDWVMSYIERLRNKAQKMHAKTSGSK